MITNDKKTGLIPYWLMIISCALIGRYISIYVAGSGFILMHILYAVLFYKESVSKLVWLLFFLTIVLPFIVLNAASAYPQFYEVIHRSTNHSYLSDLDCFYYLYGGAFLGLICLGFIYQQTSFYNVGFGKGGGGFFIISAIAGLCTIIVYYRFFMLS